MFKLQFKERDKKDKYTCMSQVCALAYALFVILLYYIALLLWLESILYCHYAFLERCEVSAKSNPLPGNTFSKSKIELMPT